MISTSYWMSALSCATRLFNDVLFTIPRITITIPRITITIPRITITMIIPRITITIPRINPLQIKGEGVHYG